WMCRERAQDAAQVLLTDRRECVGIELGRAPRREERQGALSPTKNIYVRGVLAALAHEPERTQRVPAPRRRGAESAIVRAAQAALLLEPAADDESRGGRGRAPVETDRADEPVAVEPMAVLIAEHGEQPRTGAVHRPCELRREATLEPHGLEAVLA